MKFVSFVFSVAQFLFSRIWLTGAIGNSSLLEGAAEHPEDAELHPLVFSHLYGSAPSLVSYEK